MYKIIIVFFILIFAFPGCSSTKAIRSARESIIGLEQLNAEQESRNIELEKLIEAERAGNSELRGLLDGLRAENEQYFESERLRNTEKREILDRLESIFSEESDIIEKLISGYNEIRAYFEALEIVE